VKYFLAGRKTIINQSINQSIQASYFHCNIKAENDLDTIHNHYTPRVAAVRAAE
jgi:hypothetical protein